ncbi:MAG: beta-lactamase family protein [Acidobacteriota bacterium]|nr:beta-lactamase family protein [Acidobacteriota bacterium]
MFRVLSIAALVLLVACAPAAPPRESPRETPWPTEGWTASTPEAEGLDAGTLAALDAEFASGSRGQVTGMLVVRHGRVVFDKSYPHDFDALFEGRDPVRGAYNYYDPAWHPYYQHGRLHTMQSVSKSVSSALVGIAIGRGELPPVEAKVLASFDTFRLPDADSRRSAITLETILTMTTGIRWDESTMAYTDPTNSCAGMEKSDDWIQFVLDQPMADEPGSTFVYNSGATELLSYLIKKGTGKEAHEYAAEHLFGPLGITDTYWKTTPKGLADTEGGLYLTARDLAKIGYLYLHDGMWDGTRLLPEGWVKASTTPHVDTRPGQVRSRKYGYQWWVLPYGTGDAYAYAALGYGGQRLIVVPEHDLIAVFTGWNIYEHAEFAPYDALDRVLAAVKP